MLQHMDMRVLMHASFTASHASSISHASPGSINVTCLQAFGSTASLETAYYRHTGKQLLLSEQQLMDCAWNSDDKHCAALPVLCDTDAPTSCICSCMRMMVSVMVSALWGRQLVCRAVAAFAAFMRGMMSKLLWQELLGPACG